MVLALVVVLGACEKAEEETVLYIGSIPDQDAIALTNTMELVADYLEEELEIEVEYVPASDYAALVSAFERGDMHLAWFGGLTGVQARSVAPGSTAIAQRPKDAMFQSVFIAHPDLQLSGLEDITGKTFTFGSESSTSGTLMPRYFMAEAGIDVDNDLAGAANYSGNHNNTITLVETGAYEVGALNISVWEKAVENSTVDLSQVDVFYTTPYYYDYNWTLADVDTLLGVDLSDKIVDAVLELNEAEHPEIMSYFNTNQFIETNNANYSSIEQVAKELGIIK